jgi:hypothetical protein
MCGADLSDLDESMPRKKEDNSGKKTNQDLEKEKKP